MTYESNIAYTMRFMIDTKVGLIIFERETADHQVVGMNWVEFAGEKYELHEGAAKRSLCQIELTAQWVMTW
jgi:DNA polymerase delta subunit 1